jgi:uncharacterized membrane protein
MRHAALTLALLAVVAGVVPAVAAPVAGDVGPQPSPAVTTAPDAVVSSPGTAAVAPDAGAPSPAAATTTSAAGLDALAAVGPPVAQTDDQPLNETTRTRIKIELHDNTSARWSVTTRLPLDDGTERAAFRDLLEEYRDGGSQTDVETFRNYARLAENYTGREMAIERVETDGYVDEANGTGVLNLTFTWTNFAERMPNDRLRVKDAFLRADGEAWFPRLTAGQTLVIQGPEQYTTYRTPRAARQQGRTVIFEPQQELDPDEVFASFEPQQLGPAGPFGDLPAEVLLGAVLVLVVAVAAAAVRLRGDDRSPVAGADGRPEGADTSGGPGDGTDPTGTDAGAGAGAGAAGAAGAAADEDDEGDEVDVELLSDEERVEHLLEQNGGRMKQANIVKETGWSDAKVSQLLSAMADEGRVNKLRLGRENLISLPDDEE